MNKSQPSHGFLLKSCVVAHSIDAIFTGLAPVVASAAMPFVESNLDALSTAANLGELALVFACAAVVVVRRQKDAFVVAASGGGAVLDVADLFVFVAVVGGSRVSISLLEETAYPFEITRLWQHGWTGWYDGLRECDRCFHAAVNGFCC
ncbi:hypothetical protein V6N13_129345 [Hibiscus sabdariffa]